MLEQTKIVWHLKTRFPGAKCVHKGPVQLLILAFEDHEITMNAHCYCGTNHDCSVAIKKNDPTLLVRGVIAPTHPHMAHTVQDMLHSIH